MRGGLRWLESFDFYAEAGQCVLPLLAIVLVVCEAREEVARDCEAFSIDEIGWRSPDVWFERRSKREKSHREFPEPAVRVVVAECHEGLFESSVEALHHAVGFRVVSRRSVVADAPGREELSPHVGSELTPAVSGHCFGDAKGGDPTVSEGVDDGLRSDVL